MQTATVNEIFEDHEDNRPATPPAAAKPSTIDPPKTETPDTSRDWDAYRDKYGRKFDPELHRYESDGTTPRINKRDGFLSIRPGKGKPPKAAGPAVGAAGDPITPEVIDLDATPADLKPVGPSLEESRRAAQMSLVLFERGITGALGPAWAFKKESIEIEGQTIEVNEADMFLDPLAQILNDNGVGDLPPGLALTAAALMYVGNRTSDEKAAGQITGAFHWIRDKIKRAGAWLFLKLKR